MGAPSDPPRFFGLPLLIGNSHNLELAPYNGSCLDQMTTGCVPASAAPLEPARSSESGLHRHRPHNAPGEYPARLSGVNHHPASSAWQSTPSAIAPRPEFWAALLPRKGQWALAQLIPSTIPEPPIPAASPHPWARKRQPTTQGREPGSCIDTEMLCAARGSLRRAEG